MSYATFGLKPAMRAGGLLPGGGRRRHREFLDFTVDGRPLLLRLTAGDTVTPLVRGRVPARFTAQVRRLLLESVPPLAGGRYVLYGCAECAALDCGAVTAVVERQGPDVVWRDFAWQCDEVPDFVRHGYPDIGPFRFNGDQYRYELERLLARNEPEPGPRVLLIGHRAALLARLAAALRGIGIGAEISREAVRAHPAELLRYGAVLFGDTVDVAERAAVRRAFEAAGSAAVLVEPLAPVLPLLVAQLTRALDPDPAAPRSVTGLSADEREITLDVATACRVRLVVHRLGALGRNRDHDAFDGILEPGRQVIAPGRGVLRARSFVVAHAAGGVLTAPVESLVEGPRQARTPVPPGWDAGPAPRPTAP
ncbi:oxidoreductase [Streptomyces sp. NPDC002055]|uniref:oxidoreductase n=1 Tax=Streptomyces sp. NPDC002055 TaxID=3154534 RepID=UPI00332EAD9F